MTGRQPEHPRGDDEWSITPRKRLTDGLDGAAISIGCALEIPCEGEVMLEREMDDAVRRGGCAPHDSEVIDGAAKRFCPGGDEGGGRGV
jgi:hypothetical protein